MITIALIWLAATLFALAAFNLLLKTNSRR
jgi:hypothetical protein